jgi:hypothetical protein
LSKVQIFEETELHEKIKKGEPTQKISKKAKTRGMMKENFSAGCITVECQAFFE